MSASVHSGGYRMKMLTALAATTAAFALVAGSANATTSFVGSYNATFTNPGDPGLVPQVSGLPGSLSFDLNVGDSTGKLDLFQIYTNEGSVDLDDILYPTPIKLTFNFTSPVTSGSVNGSEVGQSFFFGLYQQGNLTWQNGGLTTLNFGNGGKLQVHLYDTTFDGGIGGLNGAPGTVQGEFKMISGSVPEPATWAMMITGFGLVGATIRRRRAIGAAA